MKIQGSCNALQSSFTLEGDICGQPSVAIKELIPRSHCSLKCVYGIETLSALNCYLVALDVFTSIRFSGLSVMLRQVAFTSDFTWILRRCVASFYGAEESICAYSGCRMVVSVSISQRFQWIDSNGM